MLPDKSVLIGQKLVENAKIQKSKCDILSNFQTLWLRRCLNFTLVSILKSKLPKASFIRHRQFHADTLMMVLKLLKVHLIPAQKFTCKDLKLKLSEDTFCTCLKPIIISSVTKVWLLNLTQKYSKRPRYLKKDISKCITLFQKSIFGPKIRRKSLLQHCERSKLGLHFEWTKVH